MEILLHRALLCLEKARRPREVKSQTPRGRRKSEETKE